MNRHNYNYIYSVGAISNMLPSCYMQQSTKSAFNLWFKSIERARTEWKRNKYKCFWFGVREFQRSYIVILKSKCSERRERAIWMRLRQEQQQTTATNFLVHLHNGSRSDRAERLIHRIKSIDTTCHTCRVWHHFFFNSIL